MMQKAPDAVAVVYNDQVVLRGLCGELAVRENGGTLYDLLNEMRDQHARHAAELANLLSDRGVSDEALGWSDVAAGDDHPDMGGINRLEGRAVTAEGDTAETVASIREAEADLIAAYEVAIAQDPASALVSTLKRQRNVLMTTHERLAQMFPLAE